MYGIQKRTLTLQGSCRPAEARACSEPIKVFDNDIFLIATS